MGNGLKRTVVYIPGYDLRRAETSFQLLKTELGRFLKRQGVAGAFGDFREGADPGGCSASWTGRIDWPEGRVETRYFQLGWRDLAKRDFRRSWLATVAGAAATFYCYARSGGYWAALRTHWPHALYCLYPPVTFLLYWFLGLGLPAIWAPEILTGLRAALPSSSPAVLAWVGLPAVAVTWMFGIHLLTRLIEPLSYFWYIVHSWYAVIRMARNDDPEVSARIEEFADRILEIAETCGEEEELLLVAHSAGTFIAIYVLAAILRKKPDFCQSQAGVVFLTLSSAFSYVGGFGAEHGFGKAMATVAGAKGLDWTDIYSPHDILCIGRTDPVAQYAGSAGDGARLKEPRRYSARIPDRMERARHRYLQFRFFQMHFSYFLASIRPDIFDFYQLTLGRLPAKKQLQDWGPG